MNITNNELSLPKIPSLEQDIYKKDASYQRLCEEIRHVRNEMETAFNLFQNASDPDLIDAYIYQGNAAWKRYCFLLKQAKLL